MDSDPTVADPTSSRTGPGTSSSESAATRCSGSPGARSSSARNGLRRSLPCGFASAVVKFGALRDPAGGWTGVDGRPVAVKNFLAYTLRRLGTDHVDIYRLGRFNPEVPIEETVGAIAEMIEAGYVRHVGSRRSAPRRSAARIATHPISDLQIEYSLISRGIEQEILPTCGELGIGVTAYGVLSRGLLSGHWSRDRETGPADFRSHSPRFSAENLDRNLALVEALRKRSQRPTGRRSRRSRSPGRSRAGMTSFRWSGRGRASGWPSRWGPSSWSSRPTSSRRSSARSRPAPRPASATTISRWRSSTASGADRRPMRTRPLTAERILQASEDVLRRYGPAKATVVDVARELDVSHGSVYRHFPSKAALRDAVAERWLASISEPLSVGGRQGRRGFRSACGAGSISWSSRSRAGRATTRSCSRPTSSIAGESREVITDARGRASSISSRESSPTGVEHGAVRRAPTPIRGRAARCSTRPRASTTRPTPRRGRTRVSRPPSSRSRIRARSVATGATALDEQIGADGSPSPAQKAIALARADERWRRRQRLHRASSRCAANLPSSRIRLGRACSRVQLRSAAIGRIEPGKPLARDVRGQMLPAARRAATSRGHRRLTGSRHAAKDEHQWAAGPPGKTVAEPHHLAGLGANPLALEVLRPTAPARECRRPWPAPKPDRRRRRRAVHHHQGHRQRLGSRRQTVG